MRAVVLVALLACACRTYDTLYTDDGGAQCVAPHFPCNGVCVDPTTDCDNCGGCGAKCNANELCTASKCVACPKKGQLACGTSGATFCDDVATDNANCGTCGNVCLHGTACSGGSCVCSLTTCGADCVDTSTDVGHCGNCDTVCSATAANEIGFCTAGQCSVTCAAPFADCDGAGGDGCEANLQSSATSCGACGRACVASGACATGACPVTKYLTAQLLGGLAVDSTYVYWGDRNSNGAVRREPVGSGTVEDVAADNSATLLAVDATRIVWLHLNTEIDSQLLSGGSPTVLASASGIRAIALAAGTVFFGTSAGAIARVTEDGASGVVPMTSGVVVDTFAVDTTDLYFSTNTGLVYSLPVGAQNATPTVVANTTAVAVAVDATHVYWASGAGDLVSQPKGGTQSTTLLSGQSLTLTQNLATDGVSLYWATTTGDIVRMPVTGGATLVLATKQPTPITAIALDATRVYWITSNVVASTTK